MERDLQEALEASGAQDGPPKITFAAIHTAYQCEVPRIVREHELERLRVREIQGNLKLA